MSALLISDLHVSVDENEILKGVSLEVKPGEVHAVMGPNGAGKSTLAYALAGRDGYEVIGGTMRCQGKDISAMSPDERAAAGLFLAFQYPTEIPGVTTMTFLRASVNAVRKARGGKELDPVGFLKLVREKSAALGISEDILKRPLNAGFSGGEKKRGEVLQMALLEPTVAILDETDSGLDIDSLKRIADGINALRSPDRAMLIITHYQRLLTHVAPDVVHVLADGRIVRSGGSELAAELERTGYGDLHAA